MSKNANPRLWKGVFLTALSYFLFVLVDAIIKWIGTRLPVLEIFFIMSCVGALATVAPALYSRNWPAFKTKHWRLHAVRGVLNIGAFGLTIFALVHIQLANFYVLIFTLPLFLTILAGLFLHEPTGRQRWLATGSGFLGVLIILRPSAALGIGEVATLASAVCYGLDITLMRHASSEDSSTAVMLHRILVSLALVLAVMLVEHQFEPVGRADMLWLILGGVLAGIGNLMMAEGFRLATTPVAAPFHYTQLLWGIPLGYFVWRELPDAFTWLGGGVIVASGLYLLRHEARRDVQI